MATATNTPTTELSEVSVPPLGGYPVSQCLKRGSNDHDVFYDDSLQEPDTAFDTALMQGGVDFEVVIGDKWEKTLGAKFFRVPECDRSIASKKRREEITMEILKNPGTVVVVWNLRIPAILEDIPKGHQPRAGEPDYVVRLDHEDGTHSWMPGDVKHHKTFEGTTKNRRWMTSTMLSPEFGTSVETDHGPGMPKLKPSKQLAHYRRMLDHYGLTQAGTPYMASTIGKEEVLIWRDLDEPWKITVGSDGVRRKRSIQEIYDDGFATVVAVIRRARQRRIDPTLLPLVEPENKSECSSCPWRTVCHDELSLDLDHITLLPGLTPDRARSYYANGIRTQAALARLDTATAVLVDAGVDVPAVIVAAAKSEDQEAPASTLLSGVSTQVLTQLAEMGISSVLDLTGLDMKTGQFAGLKPYKLVAMIDQARVSKVGKAHKARGVTSVGMDRKAIEEDVDIEDCDGIVYMIGVRTTGRKRRGDDIRIRAEHHCFVDYTHTLKGEARIFAEWWEHMVGMRAYAKANRYGYRVYSYSQKEHSTFRALAQKHVGAPGVPTLDQINAFMGTKDQPSRDWVDLYEVVTNRLVWPTEDQTLKSIAKWMRFSWRTQGANGGESVAWYREAVNNPDPEVRAMYQRRLEEYNSDDVQAQVAIRDGISRFESKDDAGESLPNVSSLELRFSAAARRRAALRRSLDQTKV